MEPLLAALIVLSAQLAVVVGVATMAETLARMTDPRLRAAFWRGVALACLALPLLALADRETPGATVRLLAAAEGAASAPIRGGLPAAGKIVWWVLCAGALARLAWLCAGAIRLRRLRLRSRRAVLTPDLEQLRCDVARADVRISREIVQPAGFGLRHPVVLLPDGFFAMDPHAQRAVLCHELLHVARRDWPWILAEEAARALFWFHPAVWWLVDRIHETREQLVDRLVVARVPSKRAYMAALLAFADGPCPAAAATALLWKRHLRSRLRTLAKESVMSRRRLVWTAAVLVCVMGGATAGTVATLPLRWPGGEAAVPPQEVVDGKDPGVTLPKVVSEVKPRYTPEALQARIEGALFMTAVIRTDGTPADIKITQSLDTKYGLDEQAVTAFGQWRFEPGRKDGKPVPVRVEVEIQFRLKE